jgi:hypothetical protein
MSMSDRARELWERLKEAPREMGAELKQMGAHGSHELAAALFNGSAFVMYPRASRENQQRVEDPQQGVSPEAQKQQEHGGMER